MNKDTAGCCGFVLIDKPEGIASFDCIRHLRKLSPRAIKIGHAGTLDDCASGLMLIAISRKATRMLSSLSNLDKTYQATAVLGELTDTLDHGGNVIMRTDFSHITRWDLEQAIKKLGTRYLQVPPIYSSLKHRGVALHRFARSGSLSKKELATIVTSKQREATLHHLKLTSFDPPQYSVIAHVSKGTYIRSLMDDIAQQTALRATTHSLRQTKMGSITGLIKQYCLIDYTRGTMSLSVCFLMRNFASCVIYAN